MLIEKAQESKKRLSSQIRLWAVTAAYFDWQRDFTGTKIRNSAADMHLSNG
jgi:hypothetical protein